MSTDIVEQILGVVDENLVIISHHNPMPYPVALIATNRRIIVKGLDWYKKWLKNNGGVLRDDMLDDLAHRRLSVQLHFQIYRKNIAKIKIKPRRKILFLHNEPRLEIIPKSRYLHMFRNLEIHITDDSAIDKLTSIGLINV